MKNVIRKHQLFFVSLAITVLIQIYIYNQYMPNKYGFIGGDYSQFLPTLLDGYIWYKKNGIFNVPWFSPSICGGVVKFGNPEAMFYSLPQFLVFLTSPFNSIRLTFLIMLIMGYLGMYLLLYKVFKCNKYFSNLGAYLFSLNSFFMQAMIYGYFAYHSIMLVPLLIFLLMKEYQSRFSEMIGLILSAYIMSYFIYSGAAAYIIPFSLIIVSAFMFKEKTKLYFYRGIVAFIFSVILTSPLLVAVYNFMSSFPRSSVDLPGLNGIISTVRIAFKSVFFWPPLKDTVENVVYRGLPYPEDEDTTYFSINEDFEASIGPVPIITLVLGIFLIVKHKKVKDLLKTRLNLLVLFVIFIIPIAVNVYTPKWHEFLKSLPYIKNSSVLFRWFIIYMPFVVILNSKLLTKTIFKKKLIHIIFWTSVVATGVFVVNYDRSDYASDRYNYKEIEDAYKRIRSGEQDPKIEKIVIYEPYSSDEEFVNKSDLTIEERKLVLKNLYEYKYRFSFVENRNNTLVYNNSHLLCHETFYGYELENFPMKSLGVGSPFKLKDNNYNFKNPSCYQESKLNNCNPGDHFRVGQESELENFLNYKPFKWNMSFIQKMSLVIAPLFLIVSLGLIVCSLMLFIRRTQNHD